MRRGDQVLAIDGHATRDLSLQQTMAMLRGPAGSAVSIAVKHEADPDPVTLSLTRSIIRIAAVASHRIGQVAYLHVESFVPGTAKLVRKSFAHLKAQEGALLVGVVLDLRYNTGGRLDEAVATADELLPPGMPIATTKARRAADEQRFASKVGDVTAGLPMVVLVNDMTGAGSEIVASAVQAGRRAVLIGSHTAGGGSVATVIPLPPFGALRLTTQRIVLASGRPLEPPGLLPQVALMPSRATGSDTSPQEAPSNDPAVVRLRRGLPQVPAAGETFEALDAPSRISRSSRPAPLSPLCRNRLDQAPSTPWPCAVQLETGSFGSSLSSVTG